MRAPVWLLAAALILVSCGSEDDDDDGAPEAPAESTTSPTPPASPTSPETPRTSKKTKPATGTVIITADSEFGQMLFDKSGQAIYLFDKETSTRPACYDECAEAWPPVLTKGLPQAQAGVRAKLLGTTRRSDGTTQVTYGGHPLYFYANEGKYEVLCHDFEDFGGVWFVVTPTGEAAPA